ncbi:MAG: PQQ-dependent sugar dehydrogenase [Planctomycetes bacterium]|nr:PQQ-dependent sugar dehydrogenase [Planctomycetota bacterium]MBI3843515.1 PQQ-dependent sugar dehydrogenase [Planctomycetota bacterium]
MRIRREMVRRLASSRLDSWVTLTKTVARFTSVAVLGLAISTAAQGGAGIPPLTTIRVASGLTLPLYACSPPGDHERLFIVQQDGRIRILRGGSLLATDFLNIQPRINWAGLLEQGLLGLAFHPNYAANGYFYVYYNRVGTGDIALSRFHVSSNLDVADDTSEFLILTIPHPEENHNGGCIQFGADGLLYAGTGDGGNGFHLNAQDASVMLGKMLRIDVDRDDFPDDPNANYGIPSTNPFVSATDGIRDEIWDMGLRNPWRWSFDRVTHAMWIGDVGERTIEEVDREDAESGGHNYGWACLEGNDIAYAGTCRSDPLVAPVQTYTHDFGCAIIGGYVYRGCAIPGLQGTYFYGDNCSARIWTVSWNGTSITNFTERTSELAPAGGLTIDNIHSFGEDAAGELYIVDGGGEVFEIVPRLGSPDCNLNGIADSCDISDGTSLDLNGNGVPDECEHPCVDGTVGSASGTIAKVLQVDGSSGNASGVVFKRVGHPLTVTLASSPAGPSPTRYVVWVHRNAMPNPQALVVGSSTIGCTLEPSPFAVGVEPHAFRCLHGGFGPAFCADVPVLRPSPTSAPWTQTRGSGFPMPVTFVLQGVIDDAAAGNPSGKSVTNAVVVVVQ